LQRRTATSVVVGFLAIAFAASWIATSQNSQKSLDDTTEDKAEIVYLGSQGVVFQDGSNDCGVAALVMVLDHYGLKVSQREMKWRARMNFEGTSLLTMKELARSAGLDAEGWKLSFDDLPRIQFPAIFFIENHHFVVVDSVDGHGFLFVRDPAAGRLKIPRRKAIEIWKGEALVITAKAGDLTRETEQWK
jgi:ABC-type bacteriocin/lantibiotic exporter with double-glycine peptidase domain